MNHTDGAAGQADSGRQTVRIERNDLWIVLGGDISLKDFGSHCNVEM